MNFAERLKEERVRLGFNQGDFAAFAGVAKTSQFNYEKGERSPDAAYLEAVAAKGVDVLYVITGERKPLAVNSLTEAEAEHLARFRALDQVDKEAIKRFTAALAAQAERG